MKVLFYLPLEEPVQEHLAAIASKYETDVKRDDDGVSYFVLARGKLQVKATTEEERITVKVWGANKVELAFLQELFGEPAEVEKERLSPLDFAKRLVKVHGIFDMSKAEIIEMMDIDDKQYQKYQRFLKLAARRANATDAVKKAVEILKD